jgi:hypothetical protein
MKHVVNLSGGLCSWMAARRVMEQYGNGDMTLLFADVKMEDEDLYRFLNDVERDIGVEIIRIADGRTPWEVFKDERFLGNSRVDPCSRILKRELLDRWHRNNCDVLDTIIHVGLTWDEGRLERFAARMAPWKVSAPLCNPPYLTKSDLMYLASQHGIEPPRLNREGFPHNNCGGFCVKAGQAQFALLLRTHPERYAFHEQKERELREYLGKDVSILRDRSNNEVKPLTLEALRLRIECGQRMDEFDWGGCGCAID